MLRVCVLFAVLALLCRLSVGVNVTPNPKYSFEQCLVAKTSSFGYCVGISALNKLQSIDNDPEFDIVDGVTYARDEQQPRGLYNFLERDPADFGGILDTMTNMMSFRTLRWDMSTIYPGLLMRVTPSVDGVLEFVMNPLQDEYMLKNGGHYKELGTGRLLARHFVVPFLLGFKFKVATLLPIVFGILALLAKKALIVSKAALVISSSLALGSLLFGSNGYPSHHQSHFGHTGPSYAHHHQHYPGWSSNHHYKTEDSTGDFSNVMYKGFTNSDVQDPVKFSQINLQQVFDTNNNNNNDGRNFAWNDSEKGNKP